MLNVQNGNGAWKPPTFWMPEQASTLAPGVDWVYYVIYWISVAFFVGIVGAMVLFLFRYRRRAEGEEATGSATHNTPLELTWTILPLVLVIWIFYVGFKGYLELRVPPGNSYQVLVTAQKWSWSFTYPNGYVDNVLHVPVDTPVELTMSSEDVIHSFFVPSFRIKMDVLPGKYTKAWFEATKPGEYQVFCTEYCGTGHSAMLTSVVVHASGEFEPWLQQASDFLATMSPEDGGARLYQIHGCTQCHSVDGRAGIGPTFLGVWGKEETLSNGERIVVDENYIRQSILDPQSQIVAGYQGVMPTYQGRLKDKEITAIIAYIKSLGGEDI
jgi:cytochrome c oxidase subunit 2